MDRETENKIRRKKQILNEKEIVEINKKAREAGISYGQYVARAAIKKHMFDKAI